MGGASGDKACILNENEQSNHQKYKQKYVLVFFIKINLHYTEVFSFEGDLKFHKGFALFFICL